MYNKLTVEDVDVKGKKVLVRCDFNVPLDADGNITDENRIVGALPTIKYLIDNGARVILCSHMGKPKGEPVPSLSLAPVAKSLSEKLGKEVVFAADDNVVGDNAKKAVAEMNDGDVVLLQNTRYRKEETKNEEAFSKELASLADLFVNDAFGTAHRAHASNVGISANLEAVAGFLLEKEIEFIGGAVDAPQRPMVAILGGAKVSDKIGVIENLLDKADKVLVGGGMMFTFLKAQGKNIGKSLCEEDKLELAKALLEKGGDKLVLPIDTVAAKEFSNDTEFRVVSVDALADDEMGLDVGPATVELFSNVLKDAKTVVWNGPMGVFEMSNFAKGTIGVCEAIANLEGAITIIGGGDSAAAAMQLGYADKFSHISTGGGASLEYLEGKELPGVASLSNKCCGCGCK